MNTNASAPRATSSSPALDPSPISVREHIGTVVCRVLIPLWLLAGAAFKLAERNPNLLPAPVKNVIFELHMMLGLGTLQEFMSFSMRSIIAVEFILAAAMICLPRISRWVALATLGLFIAILGWLVWTGKDQCGCFGTSGPSPRWMLAFDAVLFVLAAIFGPAQRGRSTLGFVVLSVLGAALALGLPEKAISIDLDDDGNGAPTTADGASTPKVAAPIDATATTSPTTTPPAIPDASKPADSATPPTPPPADPPVAQPPPPAAAVWPGVPEKPMGFYLPDFKTWTGQRLSAQSMMHMMRRPLPEGIDQGKWHIIFYRLDCDHCRDMLDQHFVGKLETRTLLVSIPDASPGAALTNNVTDAVKTQLLRGANGPDYVVGTPVVITVVDGVVKAVCEEPAENEECLLQTLDAK